MVLPKPDIVCQQHPAAESAQDGECRLELVRQNLDRGPLGRANR